MDEDNKNELVEEIDEEYDEIRDDFKDSIKVCPFVFKIESIESLQNTKSISQYNDKKRSDVQYL